MSRRAWTAISVACLLAALAVAASTGMLVRDPNRLIHVRWRDSLDLAGRTALERRFNLQPVGQVGPATWRYEVFDPSAATIADVVRHPDVDDTHFVDRTAFAIQPDAPLGERRPTALAERWGAFAFALVDYGPRLLLVLALGAAFAARWPHLATAATAKALLVRGIPDLTPRGLAVFRLAFGLALAAYIVLQLFPLGAVSRSEQRADVPLINVDAIQWLSAHPPVVRAGQWLAIGSALLFAAGIWPRVFYAVTVAGIVQWLLALSLQSDSHPFGVLLLPLVALLAVPWDAAPVAAPAKRYGYAPWLLCFAVGVAWLGAAWAKVREGPGWILNGTVRYHFVSDSYQAPVDWGLAIATMPWVAVLLSAGAVLIETSTIAAAFTTKPALRMLAGAAAMSVLAGFFLFQGLVWPAWWLLLLGFLPWQWFNAPVAAGAPTGPAWLPRSQAIWIAVLAGQQLVMSAAFIELPPFASRYDMYSKTHASPEDYMRENPGIGRRILAEDGNGTRTDLTECASRLERSVLDALSAAPLKACPVRGNEPVRYLLLEDKCLFDWDAGDFRCQYRDKVIATVPASE